MTIDFKGVFRNKNSEQRKINGLERLESRRWVKAEDVNVIIPYFFKNFDIRAVQCTYRQGPVHRQFHVAGARSFHTCG
jgi:hypothetical protein